MTTVNCESPLWTQINQTPAQYPWLSNDITCDVAIIGGGVCGAMCAMRFAHENISCALLESRSIGGGQTAYSLGILSCYPGCGISRLSEEKGMDNSVKIFEMCTSAVNNVERMCEEMHSGVGFRRCDIFSYSEDDSHRDELKKEYLIRRHNGFPVEMLKEEDCEDKFAFPVKAGLYSEGQGAELDPFLFTHALAERAQNQGAQIYENTHVKAIAQTADGCEIICENGKRVHCKKAIIATAFDSKNYGTDFPAMRYVNFTIATKPVKDFSGWYNRCMIQNTGDHSFTVRTTKDNRILISGFNTILLDMKRRLGSLADFSSIVESKRFSQLEEKLHELFPAIRSITPEYKYTAKFIESRDGLPIISIDKENPNCFYALTSGNNGIVSAEIASRLLLGLYSKQATKELKLFAHSCL